MKIDISVSVVVRLVMAVLVALVLLDIALVPIKDKPIEYHLLKFIGYCMRAMGRVYRTARRDDVQMGQVKVDEVMEPVVLVAIPTPQFMPHRIAAANEWRWIQPNPALLMVLACILFTGSLLIFVM